MKCLQKSWPCLCVVLLIVANLSLAAQPLTSDVIERWLKSQDEMMAWGNKHQDRIDYNSGSGFPANAEEMLAPVRAAGLYDEVAKLTKKYGFAKPEEWADASVRIIGAMGALEVGDSMQGIDVQQQLNQIQNSPGLSEAQKQQMMQMMRQSMQAMKQMSTASEADKAAVKPYLSQIEAVTGAR